MSKKITHKKVTRKFLNDLADKIYNSKKKTFLRLCNGFLTNGPDPEDNTRRMHCGLGELYFAITGKNAGPSLCEDDVVNLAVSLSALNGQRKAKIKDIKIGLNAIKKINLPNLNLEEIRNSFINDINDELVENEENNYNTQEDKFINVLNAIPGINDDSCDDKSCNDKNFKERSKQVAKQLRKAANLLPK